MACADTPLQKRALARPSHIHKRTPCVLACACTRWGEGATTAATGLPEARSEDRDRVRDMDRLFWCQGAPTTKSDAQDSLGAVFFAFIVPHLLVKNYGFKCHDPTSQCPDCSGEGKKRPRSDGDRTIVSVFVHLDHRTLCIRTKSKLDPVVNAAGPALYTNQRNMFAKSSE